MSAPLTSPNLEELIGLFHTDANCMGTFKQVSAGSMPGYARTLLSHNEHMTVTMEEFHGTSVDVEVLKVHKSEQFYSRKILLKRHSDGHVVQFGIVRLNFAHIDEVVRQEIEAEQTPLGRVLIKHNVLRHVQLVGLWKIAIGKELRERFSIPADWSPFLYGRTALIYTEEEPAVELLEIASPV